jgi:hypothetical protein
MNDFLRRLGFIVAAMVSTLPVCIGQASASSNASPVAVLPLEAAPGYDTYAVSPSAAQLKILTGRVRSGLAVRSRELDLLPQRSGEKPCADAQCARREGRSIGAHTVVFGAVSRAAGIFWNTRISAVDVSSGRIIDSLTYGVMGDYYSLRGSVSALGACIGRSIARKPRCKISNPAT